MAVARAVRAAAESMDLLARLSPIVFRSRREPQLRATLSPARRARAYRAARARQLFPARDAHWALSGLGVARRPAVSLRARSGTRGRCGEHPVPGRRIDDRVSALLSPALDRRLCPLEHRRVARPARPR